MGPESFPDRSPPLPRHPIENLEAGADDRPIRGRPAAKMAMVGWKAEGSSSQPAKSVCELVLPISPPNARRSLLLQPRFAEPFNQTVPILDIARIGMRIDIVSPTASTPPPS